MRGLLKSIDISSIVMWSKSVGGGHMSRQHASLELSWSDAKNMCLGRVCLLLVLYVGVQELIVKSTLQQGLQEDGDRVEAEEWHVNCQQEGCLLCAPSDLHMGFWNI